MIRDKIKNEKYFVKLLKKLDIELKDIEKDCEGIEYDFESSFLVYFKKIMANYSMGSEIKTIEKDFKYLLESFVKSWDIETTGYVDVLNVVSLSVLLKADNSDISNLKKILEKSGCNDYVLSFILNSKVKTDYLSKPLILEQDYNLLKSIIQDSLNGNKKNAETKMKEYLYSWYENSEELYWYDTQDSPFDIYFGYWCLESAALTFILELDDSSYKDNQYYPRDFVEYARG